MITHTVFKDGPGTKSHLLKDEESYIVAISEIYITHGLPIYAISLANEIQQVLHGVDKLRTSKPIKHHSTQMCTRRVIKRLNKKTKNQRKKKRKKNTGMIKVSGLIQKKEKLRDPRIAWLMLKKVHIMYRKIKKKGTMICFSQSCRNMNNIKKENQRLMR